MLNSHVIARHVVDALAVTNRTFEIHIGPEGGIPYSPPPLLLPFRALSYPTFRYRHREKPDHPHPVKDWVGLFLLDALPPTASTTPHQKPPKSARGSQGNPTTDHRFPYHQAHSHRVSGNKTAANRDYGQSEQDMKAVTVEPAAQAEADAGAEETGGESTEAGPMDEKLVTTAAGVTRNKDEDTATDAKHELGGSRSQDRRFFRSSQVAAAFLGGVPTKPMAIGGAGDATKEEERRGKEGMSPGKMVGWRTLPRENEVRASGGGGRCGDTGRRHASIRLKTRAEYGITFRRADRHRFNKVWQYVLALGSTTFVTPSGTRSLFSTGSDFATPRCWFVIATVIFHL